MSIILLKKSFYELDFLNYCVNHDKIGVEYRKKI